MDMLQSLSTKKKLLLWLWTSPLCREKVTHNPSHYNTSLLLNTDETFRRELCNLGKARSLVPGDIHLIALTATVMHFSRYIDIDPYLTDILLCRNLRVMVVIVAFGIGLDCPNVSCAGDHPTLLNCMQVSTLCI